ncbi:hypothetical protein PFZ49_02050 [Microbacterium lacticum]|uniref:hypothetical protein n=1 Tax=Microbacterium lacticum TaxID=33885 RepID=UPI003A835219
MLAHRIAALVVSVAIPLAGVAGGIVGNDLARAEQTAALDRYNAVATWNAEQAVRRSYADGQAARAADEASQPMLDAASALADSSAGKASDEARAALSGAVAGYVAAYRSANFQDGTEAQSAQAAAQDAAQTAIDAATATVNEQVAAWQTAEAQEAEVRASTSDSNDDGDDARQPSASSSSNDESDSAPSLGRAWAEGIVASIAPGVPVAWGYTPAGGKYGGKYSPGSGAISLSDNVADRSGYAYSILVHEATHAGPQRGSCYSVWKGHFGGDAERFAQAYTAVHFGTTVGAYAAPSDDDLAAAGSC